jgi:hypothetical protein
MPVQSSGGTLQVESAFEFFECSLYLMMHGHPETNGDPPIRANFGETRWSTTVHPERTQVSSNELQHTQTISWIVE